MRIFLREVGIRTWLDRIVGLQSSKDGFLFRRMDKANDLDADKNRTQKTKTAHRSDVANKRAKTRETSERPICAK